MKKVLCVLTLATACATVGAQPIGYPGSTWSVLMFPASATGAEKNNVLLQGKVEQGIDWVRFADVWKLNTYASVSYSADTVGLNYNNKVVPALGAKVTRAFDHGTLDLGVQVFQERRWKDQVSSTGVQAYASYWFGWNLK
jgi:hypothetical protein